MAVVSDGIVLPLGPDPIRLPVALVLLAGNIAAALFVTPFLWAALLVTIPFLWNQATGRRRFRVTVTKLLIEDERPVRGFLIGPVKQRFPYEQMKGAEVAGDAVKVVMADGTEHLFAKGRPEEELEALAKKINFKLEG